MIFHLTTQSIWNEAQKNGLVRPESLQSEGFVHLSTYGQVLSIADAIYKNTENPLVLSIDNEKLKNEIKWELSKSKGVEFPHLYRPIKSDEVVSVIELKKDTNGNFVATSDLKVAANAFEIETERLLLREMRLEDLNSVHAYASIPELVEYMPWGPNTLEESKAFLTRKFKEQCASPRLHFDLAVVEKQSGEMIGSVGIFVKSHQDGLAFLGYILRKESHGKGYATEFSKAMLKFGFEKLEMYRIEATCHEENAASFKVMQRIGMKKEGILRGNLVQKGLRRNTLICSILRHEFSS